MTTLYDQPPDDDAPIVTTEYPRRDREFTRFHRAHPEVYELFRRFALQLLHAGRKHGSAEQVIQRLRWETDINPSHDGGYKVSNHYRRRYALLLAQDDARFSGFFRFRAQVRRTGEDAQ